MPIRLDQEEKKARNVLIEVAKAALDTHRPGLISYKEFWNEISDGTWGRGAKTPIVRRVTRISAFEVEHERPPLNELVVVKTTGEPGEKWPSIKKHLKKKFGVDARYSSHIEAQQACWQYWTRGNAQQQTEDEIEEGFLQDRTIKFRTRNAQLIAQCKERDNFTCQACRFRREVNGVFIIDCHHIIPLAQSDRRKLTKLAELVCLCPTCHRVAHTKKPPMSIDAIRKEMNIPLSAS